ncbi:MAG TPA: hypothetical protein VFR12_07860, partial [Pyrinomonadaceae bacterium]|nr:hypothetical protein [Pyrinomonadaceae bacterium]
MDIDMNSPLNENPKTNRGLCLCQETSRGFETVAASLWLISLNTDLRERKAVMRTKTVLTFWQSTVF